jgi:hypothetical protein
MYIWCSIDPGYINFSLSILNNKTNFFINFKTVSNYFKFLENVLRFIFEYIKKTISSTAFIKFIIEKQLKKPKNINRKLEIKLCSCIRNLNLSNLIISSSILMLPAYLKNNICFNKYGLKYSKIKSKKEFKNKVESNVKLYNELKEWSIYTLCYFDDINSSNNNESDLNEILNNLNLNNFFIKKLKDLNELKKFDDFIDTILLLDTRDTRDARPARDTRDL